MMPQNGLEFGPAAKRTLYIALRHAQVSVDVVIEEDATAGHLAHYNTLYITDRHVKESAMESILAWVKTGGSLTLPLLYVICLSPPFTELTSQVWCSSRRLEQA